MIEFLCSPGRALQRDVVGVDLSAPLLATASERYPNATFIEGDILDMALKDLQIEAEVAAASDSDAPPAAEPRAFDAVVLNAAFTTAFDPAAILAHAAGLLARGGRLVVSHPLGAAFAERLHSQERPRRRPPARPPAARQKNPFNTATMTVLAPPK